MARDFIRADGDSIIPPLATWASGKLTFGAWINLRSLPANGGRWAIESVDSSAPGSGVNRMCAIEQQGGVHRLNFLFQVGLGNQEYFCTHSLSTAQWNHVLFYANAAVNPDTIKIHINGVSQSLTESGGFTNNAPGTTTIPVSPRLGERGVGGSFTFDGRMAHAFVTLDEWADNDITALAKGYSPRMFPGHAFFNYPFSAGLAQWYLPLIGRNDPETSPIAPHTATNDGTTHAAHPRMMGWA